MTFPPFPDAVCAIALVTNSLVSSTASSATGQPPRTCPTNRRARRTWSPDPGKTRRRGRITVAVVTPAALSPRTLGTLTAPAAATPVRQHPQRLPPSGAGPGTSIPGHGNCCRRPRRQPARGPGGPLGREGLVVLGKSHRKPCSDAGQETRRIARRISNLTYRDVSSRLVIFRFPLR